MKDILTNKLNMRLKRLGINIKQPSRKGEAVLCYKRFARYDCFASYKRLRRVLTFGSDLGNLCQEECAQAGDQDLRQHIHAVVHQAIHKAQKLRA